MLGAMSFDDDKLKALRALRPHILDPENGFGLVELFSSPWNQESAAMIMMPQPR